MEETQISGSDLMHCFDAEIKVLLIHHKETGTAVHSCVLRHCGNA